MSRRYRSETVTVDVEVDVDEVLSEVSAEQLCEELASRNIDSSSAGLVGEAYQWLVRSDIAEAKLCLERALFPKWKSDELCREAYQKLRIEGSPQ